MPRKKSGQNSIVDALSTPSTMNPQINENSISVNINANSVSCPHCSKLCKNQAGVSIHISKAHGTENRSIITKKYVKSTDNDHIHNTEEENEPNDDDQNFKVDFANEIVGFENKFAAMVSLRPSQAELDTEINNFSTFLREVITKIPGPQHPASRYYRMRKQNTLFRQSERKYSQSSNPIKASKRDREKRKEKYMFDVIQHEFYNQRGKVVHRILKNDNNPNCNIPADELFQAYEQRWGNENNCALESYPSVSMEAQIELDDCFNEEMDEETMNSIIKKIRKDTSSGPDKVLLRAVRYVKCNKILSFIGTIMLKWNIVPTSFRQARTVLIFKKGNPSDPSNWRPISICSILRRIIEKFLESSLRKYVEVNMSQRGFTNMPGTFINTSILDGCLKKAKKDKQKLYVALLDIAMAFDRVGHAHLLHCLDSEGIPTKLRNLIKSLVTGNETTIHTKSATTPKIKAKCGVFQGSPLSPLLFIIAINYILNELTDPAYANTYGFSLINALQKITAMNFADDTCILSSTKEGIEILLEKCLELFAQSGLTVNPEKSICICIENGKHVEQDLSLPNGTTIPSLKLNETVKYLGVDFNSQITFDKSKVINNLTSTLNKLVSTPMLRPHQKITIINSYIWPTLIYPLQMAPLNKLPQTFLLDVDKVIKSAVKEIVGIPSDSPNAMLYTSRNLRGLSITRAEWEAFLQHYNVCLVLLRVHDPYIQYVRDIETELKSCEDALNLSDNELQELKNPKIKSKLTKRMRIKLQEKEFDLWCDMKLRGAGVSQFKDNQKGNKKLINKEALTTSEWVTLLKMNANVTSVRLIPGRSMDGTQCRHCGAEKESLGHVLGSCVRGELIRNQRHHGIREIIAKAFKKNKWKVAEEVHCTGENDSTRRVDIIVYDEKTKEGYILDPTVRFESGDSADQSNSVDLEKRATYDPCVKYFKDNWNLKNIEVIGLYVGARGTITKKFQEFVARFDLPVNIVDDIMLYALRGSIQIYNYHVRN